jgi:glycogen phosphorylase
MIPPPTVIPPASLTPMRELIVGHLRRTLARDPSTASRHEWWVATCMACRDQVLDRADHTMHEHRRQNVRRLYYFSLEYLMGRLLSNNLHNSGLFESARIALEELGQDLGSIIEEEPDMGLGNGGLGRLAACFLDSLSTLDYPAVGYGIFYQFGLFRQEFIDGRQVEHPDAWMVKGSPWTIERPDYGMEIPLYGRVEQHFDDLGQGHFRWVDTVNVLGVPRDIPVVGYDTTTVNFLRLWEARASTELDLDTFNQGGYVEAVRDKARIETISKVLYPNDTTEIGKELRLVQQYFFVACSLKDIFRRHLREGNPWQSLPEKVAIQLNDTHPAVAIPELMRLLIDENGLRWDEAWDICQRTFSYTNHTLLPEALERWSVPLFEKVLPRHLQIIFEINRRFLEEYVVPRWPENVAKLAEMSLIEEGEPKQIRMASLSVLGSKRTNGVAELHSRLIKERLFPSFYQLFPERFINMTNGVTPRRWLLSSNPKLASLITESIGTGWAKDLDKLRELEPLAQDPTFQERFLAIKHQNKETLAAIIYEQLGLRVNPAALFDVQIKRLHEYKRQHLNLLHILALYRRLLHDPSLDFPPRVFIFAAKAAPGYHLAKCIIHAINAVADLINHDRRIGDRIKVAFLPNYGVSIAEKIIPASDLSEQISTAGKEASGTGNMKLALNGALTIGTLDGANVEIKEEVGDENIFIFGHTVEDIDQLKASGYNPWDVYWADPELRAVVDWLCSDAFTGSKDSFAPIRDSLLHQGDPYFVLSDFRAYSDAQAEAGRAFADRDRWARMAILNTARCGKFSSDRTIRQYAEQIWDLPSVPVPL